MIEIFAMQVDRIAFELNPKKPNETNWLPVEPFRLRDQLDEAHVLNRVIGTRFRKIASYLTSRNCPKNHRRDQHQRYSNEGAVHVIDFDLSGQLL